MGCWLPMATRTQLTHRLLAWMNVGVANAFWVAFAVGFALQLLVWNIRDDITVIHYTENVASILVFMVMIYVVRLKPALEGWHSRFFNEGVDSIGGALVLSYALLGVIIWFIPASQLHAARADTNQNSVQTTFLKINLIISPIFASVFRIAKYVWIIGSQKRHQYLIWRLAFSQITLLLTLMVAIPILLAILLLITSVQDQGTVIQDVFRKTFLILVIVGGISTIGMMCLWMLSLGVSYYTAKIITRRLDSLVNVTNSLQDGDYQARVRVDGGDEVAKLQENFNAMSDSLENALIALQAERDTVATLLKARRELFAGVSHELRTPITTLMGYTEAALTSHNGQTSVSYEDIAAMHHELVRLNHLVDDLFTLARVEVKHLGIHLETVDITPMLNEIAHNLKTIAWKKGKIEIVTDIPTHLPPICIDPTRLSQIINNLLYNAVKFTPPGGAIILSAKNNVDDCLQITVQDTGNGILPHELSRIWKRYGRASSSDDIPGTGLGLTLVKELTEAMQGKVAFQSEVGEGTCFSLAFPLASNHHTSLSDE